MWHAQHFVFLRVLATMAPDLNVATVRTDVFVVNLPNLSLFDLVSMPVYIAMVQAHTLAGSYCCMIPFNKATAGFLTYCPQQTPCIFPLLKIICTASTLNTVIEAMDNTVETLYKQLPVYSCNSAPAHFQDGLSPMKKQQKTLGMSLLTMNIQITIN